MLSIITIKTLISKLPRWLKLGLAGCGICLLIPMAQVVLLKFFNPPTTAPMVLRWCHGKCVAAPYQPNQYHWVALKMVPEHFLSAVWMTEDRHFFEHWGFDWGEIQKARADALATGKPARGASTITQQCARSLFLWQGRSWCRKGLEAYYTLWMELLLSKRRILELYVNVIELGNGVYGLDAAAERYYGLPADKLTRDQSAMLVAIMPNPKRLDPNHPNEALQHRHTLVLERAQDAILPIQSNE